MFKDQIKYIPFTQWQNALFVIDAYNNKTESTPEWLSIIQEEKSVIIDLSKATSVGDYIILLNERLVTFSFLNLEENKYTTKNDYTQITFINSNWFLSESNSTYYLVTNTMSIFLFKFVDIENDRTILRVSSTDVVNSFVRQADLNKNEISKYLQASEAFNTTFRIAIQYTDYYHQADQYYKNITFDLSIFEVDPPYFDLILRQLMLIDDQILNANSHQLLILMDLIVLYQ